MKKLELVNISKRYKNEQVLENINLEFTDNKIYGFIGRNGSGKSVLFKIICGFVLADTGNVMMDQQVLGKDMDFYDNLGAMIEIPGFIWHQSGYENLLYLARIRNRINSHQVKEAIRLVGLDPCDKKWVGKYSMGMKQRLGIAQAIMEEPDLLILYEPMNSLDEQGVDEIRKLLCDYRQEGRIVLITSHYKQDIEMLCDEVYAIKYGKIEKIY